MVVHVQRAPGWYPHPERPEEEWYWDGEAWTDSRWATEPEARKRRRNTRVQRDPAGFLRDLAALVVFLALLSFGLWAGNAWAGLDTWDMLDLPGVICAPILLGGFLLWWWLGEENS